MNLALVAHRAAMDMLAFCASFVLMLGYWLTWPYDVMQIKSLTVLTPNSEVGDLFEYRLDYCKSEKYGSLRAEIHHSFVDGLIHNMPIESGPLPPGCAATIVALVIPPIPEGNYHLEMVRAYQVNPVRKIEVRAVSGIFKISGKRRLKEMLRQQLPEVIPEVIPRIPELR